MLHIDHDSVAGAPATRDRVIGSSHSRFDANVLDGDSTDSCSRTLRAKVGSNDN